MNEPPKTEGLAHRPPAKRSRRTLWVALSTVIALAAAAVILVKICGCAGSPDAALTLPTPATSSAAPAVQADLMAGEWAGTWASDSKPLKGKLKAVITRQEDGSYRAVFDEETPLGTDHSVCVFHVSERGAQWKFGGKESLGLLKGGTYVYTGVVDGRNFVCTYDSTFDKGVFRMERKSGD